jgi:aminopeptidase N
MSHHVRHCAFGLLLLFPLLGFSQHLPDGEYHANRERTIDIQYYRADLSFDFATLRVIGKATVNFVPLSDISTLSLDAIRLNVESTKVVTSENSAPLKFKNEDSTLNVELGRRYSRDDTVIVEINYSCQPNAGLYFQKDPNHASQYFIHTYGEGGLHANWLPIYNDVNDKFSTEMVVSVLQSHVAISNGELLKVKELSGGQNEFHWSQKRPHSNYLISIYVGQFEKGQLASAFGDIPISYWVPKGRLQEGAYAFRHTTKMVEFFSQRFDYRYPWEKYDQIAVPDYAIGAMEHTSVTGHRESVLRDANAPLDFGAPDFTNYHAFWTAEGTIAHELAHHWFGDNLTCHNLSYIWLNESFASYLQMLWDEESLGESQLQMSRQFALDAYLQYVSSKNVIRPLEYHYFEKPDDIYNEHHTYLKGAIVLHMLRKILGDDDFFHGLSHYLKKHEYANVVSADLKMAFEESCGKNLDWFFDDWITGAGHPVLKVSYDYLEKQKLVDLNIEQIQPFVEGQDEFILPVEVSIATKAGTQNHLIWVEDRSQHFFLESGERPLMVSVDGDGALVAKVVFEKTIDELIYQVKQDRLPGKIWALRQLAAKSPSSSKSLQAISEILSGNSFWGLQAEAALQLGTLRTPAAENAIKAALTSSDYRVRKAAALALAKFGTSTAEATLGELVTKDPHTDVAATAIVALAQANPQTDAAFFRKQLGRTAWYDEITIAVLEAFGLIGEKKLTGDIRPFVDERHNQQVRMSAFAAWRKCAPEDPQLHRELMACVEKPPYSLQKFAIELLGQLYVSEAHALLEKAVAHSGDDNLRVLAQKALANLSRLDDKL